MIAGMVTNDSKFVSVSMLVSTKDVDNLNGRGEFIGIVSSVHDKYDGEISVIGDEKPDGTYVVGTDIENGYYSVVGNNPYCSIVDSKDVILNSAERKNENQSIERDVYLTEGTKVKLHNCKLIKQ